MRSLIPDHPYSQDGEAYPKLVTWLKDTSQNENWPSSTLDGFMPVLQGSLRSTYVAGKGRRKLNIQHLAGFLSDQCIGNEVLDFILEVIEI